jgi:hypothetical protein
MGQATTGAHMPFRVVAAAAVVPEPVEYAWDPYIPYGHLTGMYSRPGTGKSTLSTALAAGLSTGRRMFGGDPVPAVHVLIGQAEDTLNRTYSSLLSAGADMRNITLIAPDGGDRLTLPGDMDEFETRVRERNARLIILDPFADYVEGDLGRSAVARPIARRLDRLAQRTRAAIILVGHEVKNRAQHPIYAAAGSFHLAARMRSMLSIVDDPVNTDLKVLVHVKSNLAPYGVSHTFTIEQIPEGPMIVWRGESRLTVHDLLPLPHEGTALRAAMNVLVSILYDRPVKAKEVEKLASDCGVRSSSTLRRAREELDVHCDHRGWGLGSSSWWSLDRRHPRVDEIWQQRLDKVTRQLLHGDAEYVQPPEPPPKQPPQGRFGDDDGMSSTV